MVCDAKTRRKWRGVPLWGRGVFTTRFEFFINLGILNCDGKRGFEAVFWDEMGVKSGKVPVYPLRKRNVNGITF